MASVSPKHDTYPLIVAAGEFSVSILAGDQIAAGQYFSYPGRRLQHVADELLTAWPGDPDGPPVVPDAIAWLRCTTFQRMVLEDHELFFARVTAVVPGRLREPPLLYSSRLGLAGDGRSGPRTRGQHPRPAARAGRASAGSDDGLDEPG